MRLPCGRREQLHTRQAEHGVELVDGAVGADAEVVRHLLTADEAGRAAIAGARVDSAERDHGEHLGAGREPREQQQDVSR